ncbi:MAG: thiamine pyrophosphate-binding protein [Burkholderiales bacterium]|nr:thiamine pyrophosphate-binding protein [Burkholderiales bacterium]
MPQMNGAQALVKSLEVHGVDTVFGVLGSTLLPVYDELYEHPQIRLIAPRGEDGALHMADAYARVTGKVGVGMITVGAGAAFSVSAMGEAWAESWPVLNIVTQIPTPYLDKDKGVYHECHDQMGMFRPVTGWCRRVLSAAEIPYAIYEAFFRMRNGRPRPVMLEIPADVLRQEAHVTIQAATASARPRVDEQAIKQAADLLIAAKRPLLWAGGGVVKADAGGELLQLCELLQAPVLATNGSKGVVPDDYPLMLGNILTQSPVIEQEILNTADVMLALGTRFSERATRSTDKSAALLDVTGRSARGWTIKLPAQLIHADIDPSEFNRNVPAQLTIHGDAKDVIARLLAEIKARSFKADARRVDEIRKIKSAARAALKERVPEEMQLLEDLRAVLPRNAIVTAQSIVGHWARYALDMYEPGQFLFANSFGSMGYAFHAAIGAKIARPDCPVVALCGDGGLMFGCGELATIAHYKLAIPIVIFNNGGYKILQNTQKRRYGRHIGTDLTNPDFVKFGESFGFHAKRVNDLSKLAPAIADALQKDRATVIEVPADFKPYR